MTFLIENQWAIFITLEVSALICLLLFAVVRYAFTKVRFSYTFLFLFIVMILLEALLAYLVYLETGEFTTFQIVIMIFIIYAGTFGVSDFKRMNRWVKDKVGKWKGIDLLTEKDREIMAYLKDPKVIARRARYWFYAHTVVFISAIYVFWLLYGNDSYSLDYFIVNLEWYGDELLEPQPFTSELITNIVRIWTIVFVVDSIINWSYTLFPSKK